MKTPPLLAALLLAGVASVPTTAQAQERSEAGPQRATVAGGCFWCVEADFDKLPGVISTTSGYTGGRTRNPSYKDISSGSTGHLEVVEILFDPGKLSYADLLEHFWKTVDPLDGGGQFCDRGEQYTTAIFVHDDTQREVAESSKRAIEGQLGREVATRIREAAVFYPAEEYHQDYYRKNPIRYRYYRTGCGRDARLKQIWGS
jgi:peptide-methionine (S)-S-oxide reductase